VATDTTIAIVLRRCVHGQHVLSCSFEFLKTNATLSLLYFLQVFDVQSILGHCINSMTCVITATYPDRGRDVVSVMRDSVHFELDEVKIV
jgi:hypothetical protein